MADADAMQPPQGGDLESRYRATRNVTLVGAVANLLLAAGKILVGVAAHSQALIADGVHSLSDLMSDGVILVAARHTHREADEEHPYGHGRIETLATVALGVFLVAVAIGIMVDAVHRLLEPARLLIPGMAALAVAALSVLVKEGLYHYTVRVARRLGSNMLRANAWHHRTDAISSIVVILGVLGTMAGLTYLDAIAAVVVSLMIAKAGWDFSWHSLRELIDTALDPERVERIRQAILDVDGVQALHLLRTRTMSGKALVDVHILVDPKLSVSEGHQISEAVRAELIGRIDEVGDVTVHIDPEDDEISKPNSHLPLRHAVLERLGRHWRGTAAGDLIEDVTLHYLNGRLHVELILDLDRVESLDQARQYARELARISDREPDVAHVDVAFR